MMKEAGGMSVTFHRAFDVCKNPAEALEDIITLGCHRLLTSGQQQSAFDGIPLLRQLTAQANGRIIIMPGAGVNPQNAMHILSQTGATEIHGSLRNGNHTDAQMVQQVVEEFGI
jgi:copper homeostasis protein